MNDKLLVQIKDPNPFKNMALNHDHTFPKTL
jgi:hypothetical protein